MKPINEFFRLKFPFKLQDVNPYAIVKQRIEVSQHSKMGGWGMVTKSLAVKQIYIIFVVTSLIFIRLQTLLEFLKLSHQIFHFEIKPIFLGLRCFPHVLTC